MSEQNFSVQKKIPIIKYWLYFILIETIVLSLINPFLKYAKFDNYLWIVGYLAENFGTAIGYSLWAFLFCMLYRVYIKVLKKTYSYKTDTNLLMFGIAIVIFAMYGLYAV